MRAFATVLLLGAALVAHAAAESCSEFRQQYDAENFETLCSNEGNVCINSAFAFDGRNWSWGTCTNSAQVCNTAKAVLEGADTCTQYSCEVSCVAPVDGRCADFQCVEAEASAAAHSATSAVAAVLAAAAALAGWV